MVFMKIKDLTEIENARAILLRIATSEARVNPLLAAFLGWLLRDENLLLLLEGAAVQAAAASGAERNSRNVAVLGFACDVEQLTSRFSSDFASQLDWSIGRPNFAAGGEPCGLVADPLSFAGILAGGMSALDFSKRQQFDQWAISIWKDSNELLQGTDWRRGLLDVMGRRISVAKVDADNSDTGWLAAALHRCGWGEHIEITVKEVMTAAISEASEVSDGFEAGLRVAAIDWVTSRLNEPITLLLSGGGLRATLFQLGMVAYLANTNELRRIRGLVSVSGGSILAAHLMVNWKAAIESSEQFTKVAASLVRFARSNVRDQVMIPWLWSRLNPINWFRGVGSRSGRLRAVYARHFAETRLGDLNNPELPEVAFVATDAIRLERIAFTARHVARFPVSLESIERGYQTHIVAESTGVPLALAVATSSCFPPVFPRMRLDHSDFGLHYDEFKDELSLNDGGVIGNLGIEVLLSLHEVGWKITGEVIVVDAERPQGAKPGGGPLSDLGAQGSALSQAAIEMAKHQLGSNVRFIRLSKRQPEPPGLPFSTQTPLALYRTDLDSPSWQECQALMLHGFTAASVAFDSATDYVANSQVGRSLITDILKSAGCPEVLELPGINDLKDSKKRPMARVALHVFLVLCAGLVLLLLLSWLAG